MFDQHGGDGLGSTLMPTTPPTTPPTTKRNRLVPNIRELKLILAYIARYPEKWDQGVWAEKRFWGTAGCVAGFALLRSGGKVVWTEPNPHWPDRAVEIEYFVLPGEKSRRQMVQAAAREIL